MHRPPQYNNTNKGPSLPPLKKCSSKVTRTRSAVAQRSSSTTEAAEPVIQSDSETDDKADSPYISHGKIVSNWFSGNGARTAKKDWDKRFETFEGGKTLIHRVISEMNVIKGENKSHQIGRALQLVEALVLERHDLFVTHDTNIKPAMFEAAEFQPCVLFRVISLLIPTSTIRELTYGRNGCMGGGNCPLWDVTEGRRNQCYRNKRCNRGMASSPNNIIHLHGYGDVSKATTVARRKPQNSSNQCLHSSIDVNQVLEKDSELRRVLVNLLSSHHLSFSHCLQTLLRRQCIYETWAKDDKNIRPKDLRAFKAFLELCPDTFFTRPPSSEITPLQYAIQLYDDKDVDQLGEERIFDYKMLFSVIKELVNRCPASLFLESACASGMERMTAYRLLKSYGDGKSDANLAARSQTEQFFKTAGIGSDISWEEKKRFLYWDVKTQRHFRLSLMGESVILDKQYIALMREKSGMRFEPVLDFVKLPYWRPRKVQALESEALGIHGAQFVAREMEKIDKDPYEDLFQWLGQLSIEKIFTVEVNDDGQEPHSNAAIRRALKQFEVEVWKWKKFDICSDTIAKAAPRAREVHLYSHGNAAILRSWAYSPGFGKLKNLQRLVVEIYPQNSNDEMDCREFEGEFKTELIKLCPQLERRTIEFNNHGFTPDQGAAKLEDRRKLVSNKADKLDMAKNEALKPPAWLDRLSNYIQFMSDLEGICTPVLESASRSAHEPMAVKVAILDNGCNLVDLEAIQKGVSFRSDHEEFFVGPCSHGTQMVHCVRDVCPKAELYIARLDDSQMRENQHFTIASCCEALRWAIEMGVDVISMSWTFKRTGSYDYHEMEFKRLIEKAVRNNILLFASLPDKTLEDTSHFAPVSLEGVIKIGSATVFGESSKENRYAQPDFLLPGEGISLSTGEIAKGSSFSTAYASGLAASLLYCLRAHRVLFQPKEDSMVHRALIMAKTVKGMKGIFKRLGSSNNYTSNDAIFVQPYQHFPHEFGVSAEEMKANLGAIVNEITPNTDLLKFY